VNAQVMMRAQASDRLLQRLESRRTMGMAKRICAMTKMAAETTQTEALERTLLSHAISSVTQWLTPT
jgi:hypothetical protein